MVFLRNEGALPWPDGRPLRHAPGLRCRSERERETRVGDSSSLLRTDSVLIAEEELRATVP